MRASRHAQALLEQALTHLDDPSSELMAMASRRWWSGFAIAGPWMRRALIERHAVIPDDTTSAASRAWMLGLFKYGQCLLAAMIPLALSATLLQWGWALLIIPAFYLVEAQWVFLFVLVAHGRAHPFRRSASMTRQAGGTWRVMWTVLPLAWTMLTGWLRPQGALKSWCAGCLAVVIWYLELEPPPSTRAGASR